MKIRDYQPDRDKVAAHRIWREVGWVEEKRHEEAMDVFLSGSRALVAEIEGDAECLVCSVEGEIRYLDASLPMSCVTGVTTSRVARKQGLAARTTAKGIACDAADGAILAALGIFEQGFYDQLGFGCGGYEHWCTFDPARLAIDLPLRVPRRIGEADWEAVHASRLARLHGHGTCDLLAPEVTRAELGWATNGFGLGYCDGPKGELTHHLWATAKEAESGPYTVQWMSYRTREQFHELMGLLRGFGDQVCSIKLREPQGVQFQDLLRQPFRTRQMTRNSQHESRMNASAYWQTRILDLPGCLARTVLEGDPVLFNLVLKDPIVPFLPEDAPWRGVAGAYVVTLGPESSAVDGRDAVLPTLTATVGAFTRMWLGVRPATGLAWTDCLEGPEGLLVDLDRILRIPEPKPDWDL